VPCIQGKMWSAIILLSFFQIIRWLIEKKLERITKLREKQKFSTGRLSWVVLNSRFFFSVQLPYFFEFTETSSNHLRNLALYYFHLFISCLFMCERSRKVPGTVHLLLLKEPDRGVSHLIIVVFHNAVFFRSSLFNCISTGFEVFIVDEILSNRRWN
jgi:hypothetical protein